MYKIMGTQSFVAGSLDLEKFIMKMRQGRETLVLMILFRVACEAVIFFYVQKAKIKGEKSQQQKWIIIIYRNDPRCKIHVRTCCIRKKSPFRVFWKTYVKELFKYDVPVKGKKKIVNVGFNGQNFDILTCIAKYISREYAKKQR